MELNEEYEENEVDEERMCPFCQIEIDDSGGCEHVLFTHTTCDGFLIIDPFVNDMIDLYKKRELIKQQKDDPEYTIDDIEIDDYEIMKYICKKADKKFDQVKLLEVHAVWGSTASYLVATSTKKQK